MLRAKSRQPAYGFHKASGQAVVYFDRRPIYLGIYDSAESWQKYYRLLAENPSPESRKVVVKQGDPLSVAALVLRYVDYAKTYYGPDNEWLHTIKAAITPLIRLYGSSAVDE